jgi:hypothetical protein
MSLQSNLTISGSIRKRAFSSSGSIVEWQRIPLLLKMVMGILLCLIVLTFGFLAVSRAGAIPEIPDPPELYLPGRALPQLPDDAVCRESQYLFHTCSLKLLGQTTYLTFDPNTRMIVQTTIQAREYKIGDLICAWGYPAGINRWGAWIVMYWGNRSAVLYADSFRPESPVEFIQYDMQEHDAPPWQGFMNIKSSGQSDNTFGNS